MLLTDLCKGFRVKPQTFSIEGFCIVRRVIASRILRNFLVHCSFLFDLRCDTGVQTSVSWLSRTFERVSSVPLTEGP